MLNTTKATDYIILSKAMFLEMRQRLDRLLSTSIQPYFNWNAVLTTFINLSQTDHASAARTIRRGHL